MTDFWKSCEGHTADGVFALGEFLGGSDSGGVFVTSTGLHTGQPAAIKLIPAEGRNVEAQLVYWQRASKLSHPNLVQLQHWGTCELRGVSMMYIVTELADEVLAHVLLDRPLEPREARQMIEPVAEALGYLHDRGCVHCRVKPSNLYAIGEVLKLSIDSVVPVLETGRIRREPTAYDPPETAAGVVTPAADAWSLGWTIVEVLTRQRPGRGSLPEKLPEPFEEVVQNVLRPDPTQRWTVQQVAARIRGERVSGGGASTSLRRYLVPAAVAAAVLLAGLWLWPRDRAVESPGAGEPTQAKAAPPATEQGRPSPMPGRGDPARPAEPRKPATEGAPAAGLPAEVVRQVLPDIPPRAQRTIRGSFAVRIDVDIDEAGAVKDARFASRGPSRYFADLSLQAARQWRFSPGPGERRRTIEFAFARAAPPSATLR